MAETTVPESASMMNADDVLDRIPGRISGGLLAALVILVVAGVAGFVLGVRTAPQRAWMAYLVNFLFFTGLGAAGVLFGAAMQIAKGHWGKPLHRLAQGFGAFLPLSWLLFLGLWLGRNELFPWIGNPVNFAGHPVPETWFDIAALFTRGTLFLFLFYAACLVFMYYSLRPDMQATAERLSGWRRNLAGWMTRGWRGDEEEAVRSRRILGRLSAPFALAYVAAMSGVAIDLVMTLEPGWISVLFPAYFFVGAWLSALAGTALVGAIVRQKIGIDFAENHWHDLGKLTFAFCIFWAYLWFSQFLPIWYGNMPRETIFIEPRWSAPWTAVSATFFAFVFVVPFILLLGQKLKTVPAYLATVAGIILVGFWLERFDVVVPSIWTEGIPFGWIELLVTAGFLGLFALAYALYASTVPLKPVSDSLIVGSPRTGPY